MFYNIEKKRIEVFKFFNTKIKETPLTFYFIPTKNKNFTIN